MIKRDLYYDRIPTKSLRDDVRYLGNTLGKVIRKQEGKEFYNLVEKIRLLSKANSANKNQRDPFKKIINETKNLSSKKVFKLTRAFNHFMNFVNLAESIDASRKLDEFENTNINKNIEPGAKIKKGTIIGNSGNTGMRESTLGSKAGSHLHWEMIIQKGKNEIFLGQNMPNPELYNMIYNIFEE